MTSLPVPRDIQGSTPRWLTEVLHSQGAPGGAAVSRISAEAITGGTGFMNQVARLEPHYDNDPSALPRSIILKLPSLDPELRTVSSRLGQGRREVMFYQQIAQQVAGDGVLPAPESYYSHIDPTTGNTVLLLEDMNWTRQGDSVSGCSLADAGLSLGHLAEFHASWWDNSRLDELDWMALKDAETAIYREMYPAAWKSLIDKAGEGMPPGLRLVGECLDLAIPKIKSKLTKAPRTIIHGDYRLDNCFFPQPPEPRPLVVIDWEFCARARGVYDVATFIGEAFPPDQRKEYEIALLRAYHDALVNRGVSNYSFDECLSDYRLSMLEVLVFWVVTGGHCDFDGERATRYLHNTLERIDAAISDLACTELLSIQSR